MKVYGPDFDFWQEQGIFLLCSTFRTALGYTQPPLRLVSPSIRRGKAAAT